MLTRKSTPKQNGFTLLETAIAILVLATGALTLASIFVQGLDLMSRGQFDFIAQQKAAQAIETVFTARDTKVLTWDQIRNVGGSGGSGIFLNGPQPLVDPGPDGLVGTADDDTTKPDSITTPGPDNVLGTSDDVVIALRDFTREIQITDIAPNLRRITVTIRYGVGRSARQLTLVSYISAFA